MGLKKILALDSSNSCSSAELTLILDRLLDSATPVTLGTTLQAYEAIAIEDTSLLHRHYRKLCFMLQDLDAWGQLVALDTLLRYARSCLPRPTCSHDASSVRNTGEEGAFSTSSDDAKDAQPEESGSPEEAKVSYPILDTDLELLLHCVSPLLTSQNPAVVLGSVRVFYHCAPSNTEDPEIRLEAIVQPLFRLCDLSGSLLTEVVSLAWGVMEEFARDQPVSHEHALLWV